MEAERKSRVSEGISSLRAAHASHCFAMGPCSPGGRGVGTSPQAQRKTSLPRSGRGGARARRAWEVRAWPQNTRRHELLADFVPSRVFRIGLPRHCARTRFLSSIDIKALETIRSSGFPFITLRTRTFAFSGARFRFRSRRAQPGGCLHATDRLRLPLLALTSWSPFTDRAPLRHTAPIGGSSSRLTAIACFIPSSPPGPFALPVSRLCS